MTVLAVTGAGGFLGRAILELALRNDRIERIIASDRVRLHLTHPKLDEIPGDLADPAITTRLGAADVVLHLAATLGAAAEADPVAARRLNLDATLELITACHPGARFVFASSLAVLGQASIARAPSMIYGAHKAMAEIAIETATRRGEIDGISLRPGGIVARSGHDGALKSAFLSRVFWAMQEGADITLPVAEHGTTWLASVRNVARNFLHAALADDLGPVRSLTMPMLRVEFGMLVNVLRDTFPGSRSDVHFCPDPEIMRVFGHAQPIDFGDSLAAGYRPDSGLKALIKDAFSQGKLT